MMDLFFPGGISSIIALSRLPLKNFSKLKRQYVKRRRTRPIPGHNRRLIRKTPVTGNKLVFFSSALTLFIPIRTPERPKASARFTTVALLVLFKKKTEDRKSVV